MKNLIKAVATIAIVSASVGNVSAKFDPRSVGFTQFDSYGFPIYGHANCTLASLTRASRLIEFHNRPLAELGREPLRGC